MAVYAFLVVAIALEYVSIAFLYFTLYAIGRHNMWT